MLGLSLYKQKLFIQVISVMKNYNYKTFYKVETLVKFNNSLSIIEGKNYLKHKVA